MRIFNLFFILLFFSCSIETDTKYIFYEEKNIYYEFELKNNYDSRSISDIVNYVNDKLYYKDTKSVDHPDIVLDRGYGVCRDYVYCEMALIYKNTGKKADMVVVWTETGIHGILFVDDRYYDYKKIYDEIPEKYKYQRTSTFDEVFYNFYLEKIWYK